MITAHFFQLFTRFCGTAVSCYSEPQKPRFKRAVLVHGIFEDGNAYESLRRRLESHGIKCFVPKLKPADGRSGLDQLAEAMKELIEKEFGETEPFVLISFSMGGLVSRYFLQELGGAERCEMFITVSSPHNGTKAAYGYLSKGAQQMRPGSTFLEGLKKSEGNLGEIPVVSYRTPLDLIILPPSSSVWERAENLSYNVALHPLMLHSKTVLDDIEKRLVFDREES